MPPGDREPGSGGAILPLHVFNGGFLWQRHVRRILYLAGYRVKLGRPGPGDLVGVWGQSPTAHRGERIARIRGANVIRVEDAWLRSLFPGRAVSAPPLGLLIDDEGVHFDPSQPSALERLLADHPLDDTALLDRARGAMARTIEARLTKYSACNPDLPVPDPGYVLVIDQTRNDASVTASGADRNRFLEMLYWAQENHPGARIVIKSHPETVCGLRLGHFTSEDATGRVSLLATPVSPWRLFDGAVAVYTVSSQMGFEAILAGHRPHVFGQPFYAGWGLTEDAFPIARRSRKLTRAQLFAAAMLLYPTWYDTFRDRLCSYEEAAECLAEENRAWVADQQGWVASGFRLWKRATVRRCFGHHGPVTFEDDPDRARAIADGRHRMVWAGKAEPPEHWRGAARVEDGFLRSRGLGAKLVPPLSLVLDDLGIYYDPHHPSRLEQLIAARATLRPDQRDRVRRLFRRLVDQGVTKYNTGRPPGELPEGHRILVPGQVEDDASIRTGAGTVRTNLALLETVRAAHPEAVLLYKPHPDVEAGLREGRIDATGLADMVLTDVDPGAVLAEVQEVWTMTSLLGFEALVRGVPVTTLGAPFYAGWGLTRDLGEVPARRGGDITLESLVHATLIDYPRYFDPDTGRPCPVEVVVDRLADGTVGGGGPFNRTLSKLQGLLAGQSWLWRS